MSYEFHVGQKVVCIDDEFVNGERHPQIEKGRIYVVSGVFFVPSFRRGVITIGPYAEEVVFLRLEGVSPVLSKDGQSFLGLRENGALAASRFIPLRKRETSIEIFRQLLNPSGVKETA